MERKVQRGKKKAIQGATEGLRTLLGASAGTVKPGLRAQDSVRFRRAQRQSKVDITSGWIPCTYPRGSQHSLAEIKHVNGEEIL